MERFNIGDKVIYPNQGLGVIEEIQQESYYGQELKIFYVRLLSCNTLVKVPSSNADEIGIRKPVSEEMVNKIFGYFKNGDVDVNLNWKGRYKTHQDLMRSGTLLDVAHVLKSLYYLNLTKPLSFREKKMMEKAQELIVTEVSEVSSQPFGTIEERLLAILTACFEDISARADS